ncbi:hypothetical protein AXF14_06200 [Actinomyces radicidentis]|uniref:Uncharacterized protein n=1 Tax=Actinomyces radicidentis TaxID=111015 RepID=A0A0X8JEP3_ACTRD|nr:hypothetical protein [Actinomyces radicidentis]AMD87251.1 hypothetical protein AXF14_06200 [Actinomyces radicidentis]
MESYWTPKTFVETSDETKAATAYTGDVKDPAVLGHNDEIVQSINAAGSADQTQAHRALIDADYDWKQTLPDSLGPVLGGWSSEGVADSSLPFTTAWIDEVGEGTSTGNAKKYYNYPRPYLESRGPPTSARTPTTWPVSPTTSASTRSPTGPTRPPASPTPAATATSPT